MRITISLILTLASLGCALVNADEDLPRDAIRRFGEAHRPSFFSSCDDGVFAVAISTDGRRIATGEGQGTRIWDTSTGAVLQKHPNRSTVHAVRFSPDGSQLAWGGYGNSFALIDLESGAKVMEPDVGICVGFFASFSGDGKLLLTDGPGSRGHRSDKALLWDLESGDLLRELDLSGQLWRGVLTPDGETAITCDNRGRILFWDTANGERLGQVRVEAPAALDLAIDGDGSTVAAVSSHPIPYVSIIDVAGRKETHRLAEGREDAIRAVALSPDGSLVAVSGNDRGIEVFDVSSEERVKELAGHRGGCSSLVFNKEGTHLLSGGFYGSAVLWKLDVQSSISR